MCECWYHPDLSQTSAEQLLIRDGRDGAFLVRQSESVSGAYAICVLYQQQVHTYRVLPEDNGLLSVQSVLGVDVRRFFGLDNLISAYRRRGKGLVSPLHHPVGRERPADAQTDDDVSRCSCWTDDVSDPKRFLYPRGQIPSQNAPLPGELSADLQHECSRLDREIRATWSSLRILAQLFGRTSSIPSPDDDQVSGIDKLIHHTSDVLQLLSGLEHRATKTFQECVLHPDVSARTSPLTSPGEKTIRRNEVTQSENLLPGRGAPRNLSVFVGTWNMGGAPPPRSLKPWLSGKKAKGSPDHGGSCDQHDLYVIGVQENPLGDREWSEYLRTAVTSHTSKLYKVVSSHSVGGIKLVLLVKEEHEPLISHVQTSSVRTRISNTLGVRGAAGLSLDLDGTSLAFVTCHLVSGAEKVQKRNQSYGEILRGLALGDEALRGFQLPLRFSYLFWAGDLNYKLDMPVQDVLQCVYTGQLQLLLLVDQLNQEREKKKIFIGFKEEAIAFAPTCRYERGSRTYDLQKTRMVTPSWSDRILWTSYPEMEVKCSSYGCVDDILTSDHAPVFATFEVGRSFLSWRGSSVTLRFLHIESIVKTASRSRACVEFRSLCSQESPHSQVNSVHAAEGSAFLKLGWTEQDLPEITLTAGRAFTGHLLLSIRPTDGGEPYGECCVPVISDDNNRDRHFEVFLLQRGEESGSLRGRVRVRQHPGAAPERSPAVPTREAEREMSRSPASPRDPPALRSSRRSSRRSARRSSRRSARRRPASICCGSYSNAEYFLFEGLSAPSTPVTPRPHSALVTGEQTLEAGESGRKATSPRGARNSTKPRHASPM